MDILQTLMSNIPTVLLSLGLSIAILLNLFIWYKLMTRIPDDEGYATSFRGDQLKNFTEKNAISARLDYYVEKEMKYTKRRKLEKLISQAGLSLKIKDIYIMNSCCSIVLFLLSTFVVKNIYIGVLMLIVGFILPKQIIVSIRNKRVLKLESQITSFIRMSVKRYHVTNKYPESIAMTLEDFEGQEPITSELKKTLSEIDLGIPVIDALSNMAERTSSKYMRVFVGKYKASNSIGTQEMKMKLLDSVIEDFEKEIKLKSKLKREISSPVMEGFLMMTIVPIAFFMQTKFDDTYLDLMLNQTIGKIGMAAIVALLMTSAWLLLNKIGAPLEKEQD